MPISNVFLFSFYTQIIGVPKPVQTIKNSFVGQILSQLSFNIHSVVAREPSLWLLYQPYVLWGQIKKKIKGINPQENRVGSHTELLIDGFQGSANSFATVAFRKSQKRSVMIAHHLHAPAQIITAVKADIPVLLMVREPVGAILSLIGRWNYISVTEALKSYIGFYSKLLDYTDGLLISTFDRTTQNLDLVIQEVNLKFNTNFDLVDMDKAAKEYRAEVSESEAQKSIRNKIKAQKKQEFELGKNLALLQEAKELYQKFALAAEKQKTLSIKNTQKC